ncbi:zf-CCHC domain-containing protein [Cephalotus follicularis]|uniref:Zf-CCHC domain-containing protein n=1 Tax=Cephalotus follicularis TaxID=3775 RepID=A0A1Q3ANQ1_CEPFO|nr:zf-CCHC domain-containing protein [Cephalotus follicularis]
MELGTFLEVDQKARLLESISSEVRAKRARAQQNKQSPTRPASSKWQGSGSRTKSSKNRSGHTTTQGTPSQESNARTGACYHCGHKGHLQKDCWRMNGLCLRCGESGHSVRDCPKSQATAPTGPASSSGAFTAKGHRQGHYER